MVEIIENGKHGYVVNNFSQMISVIKKIKNINKQDCVDRVKNNFSSDRMVDSYEKLYLKIIKNHK
jgi:glycosyltransferase involved in cell wall biosynthesis